MEGIQFYPPKPCTTDEAPNLSEEEIKEKVEVLKSGRKYGSVHDCWSGNQLKYTSQNWWTPSIPKEKKEMCRRHRVAGVEVRDLHPPHFLAGQQGLFAIEKFEKFDIIGEYTGRIVDDDVSGHYVAALEDKTLLDSLGLDAEHCGNEMRFINSYLNVDFAPNVTMRTVYVNTYPHIAIVCTRDIEPGEELLLDYGEAYTKAFLTPKEKMPNIPAEVVRCELPMGLVDETLVSDDEDEVEIEGERPLKLS